MTKSLSVVQTLWERRATRSFDPSQPVPDELIYHVLQLATLAPSAFNLQPWRFIVVRDAKNRERLMRCAHGQAKVAEAPVVLIVLGELKPHLTELDAIIDEEVERGTVTAESAATRRGYIRAAMEREKDPVLWATRSTMLAVGNLMIAAESLGVATAPMTGFDEAKVREAFGVPDDHTVCCLVAIGYPASTKPFPGRLGLDRVCYAEHFGQPWSG